MVTVGHEIWAMGGLYKETFQSAVEILDTRASKWRSQDHNGMKTPHAYFAAAQMNGQVYAVSGMSDRKVICLAWTLPQSVLYTCPLIAFSYGLE